LIIPLPVVTAVLPSHFSYKPMKKAALFCKLHTGEKGEKGLQTKEKGQTKKKQVSGVELIVIT
jgi:hypothetical protein